LIGAGLWTDKDHILVLDQWDNEIGFDGSVHDRMFINLMPREKKLTLAVLMCQQESSHH
jgi:hypothetical protein